MWSFILTLPTWSKWTIGIVCGVFIVWLFSKWLKWYIRKGEREDAIELKKLQVPNDEPGNYCDDVGRLPLFVDNKFYSVRNRMLVIRYIKVVNHKTEDKDKLIFATSLPHYFTNKEKKKLLLLVPQLVDVSFEKSHEILITKSAAVEFWELGDTILRFIFSSLEEKYVWMVEKQVIGIGNDFQNDSYLCFYLKTETFFHLRLLELLSEVSGTITDSSLPSRGTYSFTISKQKSLTWKNLLPRIKEVIKNYFPVAVEFTGFDVESKK